MSDPAESARWNRVPHHSRFSRGARDYAVGMQVKKTYDVVEMDENDFDWCRVSTESTNVR